MAECSSDTRTSDATSSEPGTQDNEQTGTSDSANNSFSDSDVKPEPAAVKIQLLQPAKKPGATPLNKGDHVVVNYEGCLYPGEVMLVKQKGAQVRCMERSGQNWKWPAKPDLLYYPQSDIIQVIPAPKKISS